MAFKFPSSNWQEPSGFMRVVGESQCVCCGTSHDLGKHPEFMYIVCKKHAKCQPCAVDIVAGCRANNTRIPKDVFDAGRWNSYDRDTMLPHFCDELLVEHTALTLRNTSRFDFPASTYDEAIQLYARELAARLASSGARMRRLEAAAADLIKNLKEYSVLDNVLRVGINAVEDASKDRDRRGITEIVIQPIEPGELCTGDVVLDGLSIESYEIKRIK